MSTYRALNVGLLKYCSGVTFAGPMPKNLDVSEYPGDDGIMYHIQCDTFWPDFISFNACSYVGHTPPPKTRGNVPFCARKKSSIVATDDDGIGDALSAALGPPLAPGAALTPLSAAALSNIATARSASPFALFNAFITSASLNPICTSWPTGDCCGVTAALVPAALDGATLSAALGPGGGPGGGATLCATAALGPGGGALSALDGGGPGGGA